MLTIVYVVVVAIALVILGHVLAANPAIFETRRLPEGMRFSVTEMAAVAASTPFYGWLALTAALIAAMALTIIG